MTSHGAACGVQGACRGKQKAGYSLLLSPFLRSFSLPAVLPDNGPLCHAAYIVRPLSGLPSLAPPCRARGAVHVGGGLWCALRHYRFQQSSGFPFRLEGAASARGGCCVDVSCQCTGEVRLNLTTPLWHHPFSVADRSASRAPCGRKRQRRALSLPARGSDRAGRCPALVSAVQRPNGRETLPNPPCGPLCASAPSGPAGYARRCRLRAGSAHSE